MPNAKLCEVKGLFNTEGRVVTIQNSFESDYIKNSNCAVDDNASYPDGSLIQYQSSKLLWYIEDGHKKQVNDQVFLANRFKEEDIIKNVNTNMNYETGFVLEAW